VHAPGAGGSAQDPIVINLNVRIEQEVRVKVDREVEDLLADNPELF
jgi:YnbE-like lipoprotein